MTIQSGIPVARIELLDALQVRAVNLYSKLDAARDADAVRSNSTAPRRGVAEQSERFGEIAAELGGGPFDWTTQAGGAHQALGGAPQRGVLRRSRCGPAPA